MPAFLVLHRRLQVRAARLQRQGGGGLAKTLDGKAGQRVGAAGLGSRGAASAQPPPALTSRPHHEHQAHSGSSRQAATHSSVLGAVVASSSSPLPQAVR